METAVFDKEGELLGKFPSVRSARDAHKGVKGLHYITAKDFQPIGGYATPEDLFPTPPAAEQPSTTIGDDQQSAVRVAREWPKLTGPYTVTKIGARATMDDARSILVDAVAANSTFEDYLKAAPPSVEFTTSGNKVVKLTSSHFMVYALQSKWVKFPEGSEGEAAMEKIYASIKEVRDAATARRKAEKAAAKAQAAPAEAPTAAGGADGEVPDAAEPETTQEADQETAAA